MEEREWKVGPQGLTEMNASDPDKIECNTTVRFR